MLSKCWSESWYDVNSWSYDTVSDFNAVKDTLNKTPGSAYLVNGDLYVYSESTSDFTNVGRIQGPAGKSLNKIIAEHEGDSAEYSNADVVDYYKDILKARWAEALYGSMERWQSKRSN